MKQSHKTLLLWVLLIVMFLAIWQFLQPASRKQPVAFSEFIDRGPRGPRSTTIHIKDRDYTFTSTRPTDAEERRRRARPSAPSPTRRSSTTLKPTTTKDAGQLPRSTSRRKTARRSGRATLVTLLPMVFLGVMFFLFMRQLQAGGGKAMSFGKSKARCSSDARTR